MLGQCLASVADGGLTLSHHKINASCFLHRRHMIHHVVEERAVANPA